MTFSGALLVPARARLATGTLVVALITAVLMAVGVSWVLLATPAAAHDALVSSDPADGAQLATSPTQVTLTFNNDLSEIGGQVVVTDSTGVAVTSGAPAVVGPTATLALPDPLANGAYTVTWRAVSSDSHPIEGTFAFTVADPAAEVAEAEAAAAAAAEAEAAEAEAAAATTPADETATAEPTTDETPTPIKATEPAPEEGLPWGGIIIGALLGLAAGIAITIISKRRGRKD